MAEELRNWNESVPNYQITAEDLQKPKPMFVMEAIFELFDMLGINGDGIIRSQPDKITENSEAFAELIPVMELTEAINFMLLQISPDCMKITLYDLLNPVPSTTQFVLRVLLNYKMFVEERRQDILEKEKGIEEFAQRFQLMKMEKDELMNEKYTASAVEADRGIRMKMIEDKIEHLKSEHMEYRQGIQELQLKVDQVHHDVDDVSKSIASEQIKQANLHDDINKLRSMVVSESEQYDTLKGLEIAEKLEEEIAKTQKEANEAIWMKDSTIKTLQTNTLHLNDCQNILDDIQKFYDKISTIESSNNPASEEREQLQILRANTMELAQRNEEIKITDKKWFTEMTKTKEDLQRELDCLSSNEKKAEREYEEATKTANDYEHQIKQFQTATLKYDKKREELLDLYTKAIPKVYDEKIKKYAVKLRLHMMNTFGNKCLKRS